MSNNSVKRIPLCEATRDRLNKVFNQKLGIIAENMLVEECGVNLPLVDESYTQLLQRIRFAALKLSGGTISGLRQAIDLAQQDWRDLLMAAGFGEDITEHERWRP